MYERLLLTKLVSTHANTAINGQACVSDAL